MKRKAIEEKLTGKVLVALGEVLESELRSVAAQNDVSAAELLRRSARAIIRCHHEHGEVPMDMQLIQRPISSLLATATEEELGRIIQERLKSSGFSPNDAGTAAALVAGEILRRADPKRKAK